MTWQRLGAWVATLITGLVLVVEVAVVTAAGTASNRWTALAALAIGLGSCALGLLVVRRDPRNAVGTLLCVMGGLGCGSTLSDTSGG